MTSPVVDESSEFGVFVGNALAFSSTILRHTSAEFTSISFIRIATIAELLNIPPAQANNCRIIVVDEGQASELRRNLASLMDRSKQTRVALAYRRPALAQGFLRHAAGDPLLSRVGVLPMRLEIDHWMSVLRLIICGERYIPYELVNTAPPPEPEPEPEVDEKRAAKGRLAQLTERETQVLRAVSEGKQNKIIAAELDLSEHTVKLHIHNLISKLGVNNRTEAAVFYLADKPRSNGSTAR